MQSRYSHTITLVRSTLHGNEQACSSAYVLLKDRSLPTQSRARANSSVKPINLGHAHSAHLHALLRCCVITVLLMMLVPGCPAAHAAGEQRAVQDLALLGMPSQA